MDDSIIWARIDEALSDVFAELVQMHVGFVQQLNNVLKVFVKICVEQVYCAQQDNYVSIILV
jgi:hypothetical protein